MLRRHPHLNVDISARINELGRKPDVAREFMEAFNDRILFGTDHGPDPRWYPLYYRFLGTATRSMNYSIYYRPVQGNWRVDGLALSKDTLAKVYSGNAERLIRFGPAP
jgi:predicted TIM-barrel fold metal-dependent hydrolase